jgi:hypothetical protein
MQRLYDLNGIILAVVAGEQDADFLDSILAPLMVQTGQPPHWTITLGIVDQIEPPHPSSNLIWQGQLPEGIESILTERDDQRTLTAAGQFTMTHRPASHSTAVQVLSAGTNTVRGTAAFWLIDEILARGSQFLLHGACLVRPETAEAIALFAPSGTGKTTTALALARNGLALATDDALVLENTETASLIWGIPRGIKVHQRTAGMLPWLQPVLRAWEGEEQALGLDEIEPVVQRAPAAARRCAGVIILAKPNTDGHRTERIAKADALTLILSDNIGKTPTGVDAAGQATVAAVARLVARTPTFVLSVGPDPASLDPDFIFEMIQSF